METTTRRKVKLKVISGCAIIRDDELFLLKKFKNDYFEFPGGKVDEGEVIIFF